MNHKAQTALLQLYENQRNIWCRLSEAKSSLYSSPLLIWKSPSVKSRNGRRYRLLVSPMNKSDITFKLESVEDIITSDADALRSLSRFQQKNRNMGLPHPIPRSGKVPLMNCMATLRNSLRSFSTKSTSSNGTGMKILMTNASSKNELIKA
ncbi:MAG: hypothetical protein GY816_21185 [Cytophagales bacterium]|nr:hypothetical protein [Cytophagales bacterium]